MDETLNEFIAKIKGDDNVIAKAKLINFLHKDRQVRIKDLARLLDLTPSYVCNLARLVKLPDIVYDSYYAGNLSKTHLMTISRLSITEDILKAYEEILKRNLTVLESQDLISSMQSGVTAEGEKADQESLNKIKDSIKSLNSDAKVEIVQTRVQAQVKIKLRGNRKKTSEFLEKLSGVIK